MAPAGRRSEPRSLRALPDRPDAANPDRAPGHALPGLVSLRAGEHNLPRALSSFVGRRRELEEVGRLVAGPGLVTVTGPSGMGKTRLAVELASRLPLSAGGVWMAELALIPATDDPDRVAEAVVSALRLRAQPGQSFSEVLVDHFRDRAVVLVLDNCEHLAGAAGGLAADLLSACVGLTILATSQRALDVPGEQVWPLEALSLPGPGRSGAGSDAVALFHTRAKGVNAAFVLTEEGAAAVAAVCRRLDGVPLAIELAAARAAVLAPAEIAQLLEDRFRLLTARSPATPARHQSLQAAMDWSYGLLATPEKVLLRRLSVFAGGATLSEVQAVCTADPVSRDEVLDLMSSLVASSLVVADTSGPRARYYLLESVRAYGWERLREAGEEAGVAELHAAWFAGEADQAWHDAVAAGTPGRAETVGPDHANLGAALAWYLEAGDGESALGMGAALVPYWKAGGHFREGREWLERALALGGDRLPPALRVQARWGIGLLSVMRGDLALATASLSESLGMAERHGFDRPAAEARHLLAFISVFTEDPLTALPLLEPSVSEARERGDGLALLNALILYGRAHLFAGNTAAARAVFEECREAGHAISPEADSGSLIGLGWVALSRGEHGAATDLFAGAMPIVRRDGDPFETALVLSFVGELAWRRGQLDEAEAALEEGVSLARTIGAPFPLSRCLLGLARVACSRDDLAAAGRLAEEAAQPARRAELGHALVRCLHVRADVARAAGDLCRAGAVLEEALALATAKQDALGRARSLRGLGTLARLRGDYQAAAASLLGALDLHLAGDDAGGVADTLEGLAGLALARDRAEHAARLLGAARRARDDAGSLRSPFDQPDHDIDTALARRVLDHHGFEQAFRQGSALSSAEALALARRAREGRKRPERGWAALTDTELQVVDLVAGGLTNKEIGERLFISPRTVQGHLMRVFRKVGVTSRRELRNQARERYT